MKTINFSKEVYEKIEKFKDLDRKSMFLGYLVGKIQEDTIDIEDILIPEQYRRNVGTDIPEEEMRKLYNLVLKEKYKLVGLYQYMAFVDLPYLCLKSYKYFYNTFNEDCIYLISNIYENFMYYNHDINCNYSKYNPI